MRPGACRTGRRFAITAALLLAAAGAGAQELPGPAEIDRLGPRFEPPAEPKSEVEPVEEEKKPEGAPSGAEAIRFVLSEIAVDGATVYRESDFLPLYESSLGREISLVDVYGFAAAITAMYRQDGYILSRAIVPPQRIRAGMVRLQVVEGYIDEVTFEGDIAEPSRLLRAYGDKIRDSRPLRIGVLERYLLLANDLPGLSARAVLKPSADQPGASDLTMVLEQDDVDGVATFDNRGSRFVGPFQAVLGTGFNSLVGLHERTTLRVVGTTQIEELRLINVTHQEQVGNEGTKLDLSLSQADLEPGFTLSPDDIESSSTSASIALFQPWIRTRGENLSSTVRFDYRNSLTDRLESRLSEDRLRVARLSTSYDFVDRYLGVSLLSAELSQGLNILGETPSGSSDLTRENGRSDFTKLNGNLLRLQRLLPRVSLLLEGSGQYSFSQLLASEEFGVGGAQFGRAYDPSETTGDHGVAGKIELRYSQPVEVDFLADVQFYGFYDYGVVWQVRARDDAVASAGAGLRLRFTDRLSGLVEWAKPLNHSVDALGRDGRDARIFFNLVARM